MAEPRRNDVVLTGPPRSGTTLVCELLNRVRDTVALDEPLDDGPWLGLRESATGRRSVLRSGHIRFRQVVPGRAAADPSLFCRQIGRFFDETRALILDRGVAMSSNVEGDVLGSKFAAESRPGGRMKMAERGLIRVDKPLGSGFTLCVKHIGGFVARLGPLAEHFRTYAIVRNPVATLASISTLSIPLSQGRIPQRMVWSDPELARRLDATDERFDRLLFLVHWFFERIRSTLPDAHVIRYEDIVATGGRALEVVSPYAAELDETLGNRNRSELYDGALMRMFGTLLLESGDAAWRHYYRDDDIRELLSGPPDGDERLR